MNSTPIKNTVCVEVCVDSLESAVAAIEGGATRLELCGNLGMGGGTTPSVGLLRSVRNVLPDTPVMVMIRPRIGDFIYTNSELEIMLEDIRFFKQECVTGVVFGVLYANGTVDIPRTQRLVHAATPLQVCFHRAFDMTRNPIEALTDIESIGGITRILTSGHGRSAPDSLETLSHIGSLALAMESPITILPGSGINADTVGTITSCRWWKAFGELHLSAARWHDGSMQFRKEGMGMGLGGVGEWGIWRTDAAVVKKVKQISNKSLEKV